ncbi:hypothetical protein ACHAWX_004774 [Stephanocyclus meneghinianus]
MIGRPLSRLYSPLWHLRAAPSLVASHGSSPKHPNDLVRQLPASLRRHMTTALSAPQQIPVDSFRHSNGFARNNLIPRVSSAKDGNIRSRRFFASAPSSKSSLRKLIRPFLLACHPDAMSSSSRTSQTAKQVNLKAVQILNGLIDTCDDWIDRCHSSSSSSTSPPELNERYSVEFLLPGPAPRRDELRPKRSLDERRTRRGGASASTMRSVVLEFPKELREYVRRWAGRLAASEENDEEVRREASRAGRKFERHVERELVRLLTVAGLEWERAIDEWTIEEEAEGHSFVGNRKKKKNEWTLSDHLLYELGIEPTMEAHPTSSAFYGRNAADAPPTYSHVHRQREAFVRSIRWDKFRDKYEEAWEDAQADYATSRMNLFNVHTKEGRQRRERMVSMICGRVRIWMGSVQDGAGESDDEERVEDIPEGLDVVQQLVAIRRLSSVLYDNFDYLKMEKMGRMWENLVIVLTPPRSARRQRQALMQSQLGNDGANNHDGSVDFVQRQHSPHPGRKLHKWERRMKRREKNTPPSRGVMRRVAESHFHSSHTSNGTASSQDQSTKYSSAASSIESRFKFSYGTRSEQGTAQVTVYVPIDFRDHELVQKLHTYLYDYFDNCYSHTGFLKVGPDGAVTANVDGLEEEDEEIVDGVHEENLDDMRVAN